MALNSFAMRTFRILCRPGLRSVQCRPMSDSKLSFPSFATRSLRLRHQDRSCSGLAAVAATEQDQLTKFVIRRAAPSDCGELSRMLRSLAIHERLPLDHVLVTEQDLLQDGFGETPLFGCYVLEARHTETDERRLIGCHFFSFGFCTWTGRFLHSDDVYIDPDYRGKGLGKALTHKTMKNAFKHGCKLAVGSIASGNDDALEFWHKHGWERNTMVESYIPVYIPKENMRKVAESDPKADLLKKGIRVVEQ